MHKFKIGQTVELIPDRLHGNIPGGAYTIARLMPIEAGNHMYRVKHARDGHERVVHEHQISKSR